MTIRQTCRRHPEAGRFLATCSGCAQDCHDAQYGNPAAGARRAQQLADRVRQALGRHIATAVRAELGETPTRRAVWSLHELGDLWDRHPEARITSRPVEDGTDVSLWISVRGIEVEVFTTVGGPADYPVGGLPDIWYFAEPATATV